MTIVARMTPPPLVGSLYIDSINVIKNANGTKKHKTLRLLEKCFSATTAEYYHTSNKKKNQNMRVLFDSGSTASIVLRRFTHSTTRYADNEPGKKEWDTKGGTFVTTGKAFIKFGLTEFDPDKNIKWPFYVDESSPSESDYDMIIGQDLMLSLGIDLSYSNRTITWDDVTIPMKESKTAINMEAANQIQEELLQPEAIKEALYRQEKILDANYEQVNLRKVVSEQKQLNRQQKRKLLELLKRFEHSFDGKLGTFNTPPVDFQLKNANETPYHGHAYQVPQIHERVFRKEIE